MHPTQAMSFVSPDTVQRERIAAALERIAVALNTLVNIDEGNSVAMSTDSPADIFNSISDIQQKEYWDYLCLSPERMKEYLAAFSTVAGISDDNLWPNHNPWIACDEEVDCDDDDSHNVETPYQTSDYIEEIGPDELGYDDDGRARYSKIRY